MYITLMPFAKKWFGRSISDETHSSEFSRDYYNNNPAIAECFAEAHKATIQYGKNDDEHAGEQFYTQNTRTIAHMFIKQQFDSINSLNWLVGKENFYEQVRRVRDICESGIPSIQNYYERCLHVSGGLSSALKSIFDSNVLLQAQIHYYCAKGMVLLCDAVEKCESESWKEAFILTGDSAAMFDNANNAMRQSEHGVWNGFYYNDCLANVKHSAYTIKKMRGVIRELGDNAGHDKWHRDALYSPEDRKVIMITVFENHLTDEELYLKMKENQQTGK